MWVSVVGVYRTSGCSVSLHHTSPFSPWTLGFGLLALPVIIRRRNGQSLRK